MIQLLAKSHKRGVTLLLAVLFLSASLSIALGIFYIVYVQLQINRSSRESHLAIFSADAGKECALYYFQNYKEASANPLKGGFWDPDNPCLDGGSCSTPLRCAGLNDIVVTHEPIGNAHKFTFSIDNTDWAICVRKVTIETEKKVGVLGSYTKFWLLSDGQNSCTAESGVVNRSIEFCSSQDPLDC